MRVLLGLGRGHSETSGLKGIQFLTYKHAFKFLMNLKETDQCVAGFL